MSELFRQLDKLLRGTAGAMEYELRTVELFRQDNHHMSSLAYQSIIDATYSAFPELPRIEDWQRDSDGKPLPYPIFELLFRPFAERALTHQNDPLLRDLFEFFEAMASSTDREVVNLLHIAILEKWADQPELIFRALPYMGQASKALTNRV